MSTPFAFDIVENSMRIMVDGVDIITECVAWSLALCTYHTTCEPVPADNWTEDGRAALTTITVRVCQRPRRGEG